MYMQPFELREWAHQRQQELMREYQESCADQRRYIQRLGSVLNRLGNQFVRWGEWLQTQQQTMEPQSN